MKITIVCARSPRENVGGIESYVLEISRRFKLSGHSPEIVTTAKKPAEGLTIGGIPVAEFPRWAPGEAYFFSMGLYECLKKSDAEIVHACGFNNLATLAAIAAKKKGQKLVIVLQSSGASSFLRKLLWVPYTLVFRLLSGNVDAFICASRFEKKLFAGRLKVPEPKFVVIPNGVDKDLISRVKSAPMKDQILSIGRMVKNKGFYDLIRAFRHVLEERPLARLVLVGSGPYLQELKGLAASLSISDRVDFIPNIPLAQKDRLIRLLKSSSVFALLSRYEGQGIIVSQSIAAGVPTIVRYRSALAEFVDENNAVGVNDSDSPEQIAEKILLMLQSPKRFKPVDTNIITWDETFARTLDVYSSLGKA